MIDWTTVSTAAKKAAENDIDYMRQAIKDVYGDNNLNDLGDDAYVQRKFNAAMRGSRANAVHQAYQKARTAKQGMSQQAGAAVKPNAQYGAGFEYKNPGYQYAYKHRQAQAAQPQPQPAARQYDQSGPRFQNNAYGQAARQQYDAIQWQRQMAARRSQLYQQQAQELAARRVNNRMGTNMQPRQFAQVPVGRPAKPAQPAKPVQTTLAPQRRQVTDNTKIPGALDI